MKTFKQHLEEATKFTPAQVQYDDHEMLPNAETAIEALNAYVGSIGEQEVLNPTLAVKRLQTNLSKIGYYFEMMDLDKSGTTMFAMRHNAGAFNASYDNNPYGEFQEDDGISKHIEGGISLMVTCTPSGSGKSMVEAEIVRNSDSMDEEDI